MLTLQEIISFNDEQLDCFDGSIDIEQIALHKDDLLEHYENEWSEEIALMVTDVFNVGGYGLIVPFSDLHECARRFAEFRAEEEEDVEADVETILFNSISLAKI